MSNVNNIKALFAKDGTNQKQRFPKELDPTYAKIDDRKLHELYMYTYTLANKINYFNNNNRAEGNWQDFFPMIFTDDDSYPEEILSSIESKQNNEPHLALFITFLKLFKYAQDHLNTLTKKHLDFYYQEVLKLSKKPAIPDKAHIIFNLLKNVKSHRINEGTLLKAGKDKKGQEILYRTDKEIIVNKAKIESLKTVFIDKKNDHGIYAAPFANSADGLGKEINAEEPKWYAFGSGSMPLAEIGFAIASPILFLKEGQRNIKLTFEFDKNINDKIEPQDFEVFLSGEKEWIKPLIINLKYEIKPTENNKMILNIGISPEHPPVVAYNDKVFPEGFNTKWPLLKLLLNNKNGSDIYKKLSDLIVNKLIIDVKVEEAKDLVLQNDFAVLDPCKPFQPFGPTPVIGSSFYIGSNEIFQKNPGSLELNVEWMDLPEFSSHYKAYGTDNNINNESFRAKVSILKNKGWLICQNNPTIKLFSTVSDNWKITFSESEITESLKNTDTIKKYDHTVNSGFLKLELSEPASPFTAFGHKEYPNIYAKKIIENAKPLILPNSPYTPVIKSLSISYSSSQEMVFSGMTRGNNNIRFGQFFHICPFGQAEQPACINKDVSAVTLIPAYDNEGNLYIGIKDLEPPQNLSVLFRVAEGSENPELEIEDINWSFLSENQWIPFEANQIISDTTKNLLTSGIICFNIPDNVTDNNTILPGGLIWLRATVSSNSAAICNLIDIHTQVVGVSFVDNGNDPDYLKETLAAANITRLKINDPAVTRVEQPYASFGGKVMEQDKEFYTRVSERIRHKNRAITAWDYERLVLEKFPSIHKVKCLNHTNTKSEIAPGSVSIVVIPDLRNKNAVNPFEPKTGSYTLIDIKEYLCNYISPFIELNVQNPVYEHIQVDFKVGFHLGYDEGFYGNLLNEEIKKFLSPWAFDEGRDISFGSIIYKSDILSFIEKRPYVDFVTDFRFYHFIEKDKFETREDEGSVILLPRFDVNYKNNIDQEETLKEEITKFVKEVKNINNINKSMIFSLIKEKIYIERINEFRLFIKTDDGKIKEEVELAEASNSKSILVSAPFHTIRVLKAGEYVCEGLGELGIGYMIIEVNFEVG